MTSRHDLLWLAIMSTFVTASTALQRHFIRNADKSPREPIPTPTVRWWVKWILFRDWRMTPWWYRYECLDDQRAAYRTWTWHVQRIATVVALVAWAIWLTLTAIDLIFPPA